LTRGKLVNEMFLNGNAEA